MKFFSFLLITLTVFIGYSQQLPKFALDSSRFISDYNSEISDIVRRFEEFIVYEDRSSWTKTHFKYVIGHKKNKWVGYEFIIKYEGERYFDQSNYSVKKRRCPIKQDAIGSVLNQLDSNNFYSLNLDSLNSNEIVVNDTLTELLISTDGNSQIFTVSNRSNTYTIHAYMVDSYQSRQYIQDRRVFIESRKLFLSLF